MSWAKGVAEYPNDSTFFLMVGRELLKFYYMSLFVVLLFTESHQKRITFIKEIVSELSLKKVPRTPFIYPG